MDVAAHGGQVVTDLPLLRKLCHSWTAAAEQEQEPAASVGTQDASSSRSTPLPRLVLQWSGNAAQQLQEQQQREDLCLQQQERRMMSSAPPPLWSSSSSKGAGRRWQQLQQQRSQRAALGMVSRSFSETTAQQLSRSGRPQQQNRMQQWQRLLLQEQQQRFGHCIQQPSADIAAGPAHRAHSFSATSVAADAASGPLSDIPDSVYAAEQQPEEAVSAWYLGTFTFKGAGAYEMVHILPASLAGRSFPEEPPRGKGSRLAALSGPVDGLPQVQLQLPRQLVEARQIARLQLP